MKILVTGGAGFVGSNVAMGFKKDGHEVVVLDNLSRSGVRANKEWLEKAGVEVQVGDATDIKQIIGLDAIFHFAAQVGVQTSIDDPRFDLDANLGKTFEILEEIRGRSKEYQPMIVFASTNKVYGDFNTARPTPEGQQLSFCTPYGCSKGAAEQYILDYSRVYGIDGVVLRMSCIYGNRQFGMEEQGWLCHFNRCKYSGDQITIYGDGTQVRDALYIDDYVELCKQLVANRKKVRGQVFNIGGGVHNQISVNEALERMGAKNIKYTDWRPSDQRYYVSDIKKIKEMIGWEPKIGLKEGLGKLDEWVFQLSQSQTDQAE